jgi:hypothetical protein
MAALTPVQLLCAKLGTSPVIPTKLLCLALAMAAALAIAALVRRLGGGAVAVAATPAFVLLDPAFAFGALSGMEVPLTAAALAGGFLALHAERRRSAGLAFALAALARPEAVLVPLALGALAVADALHAAPKGSAVTPSERARVVTSAVGQAVALGLPALLAIAGWAAYDLSVTGFPLPNTYYVKRAGDLAHALAGGRYLLTSVAFDEPAIAVPTLSAALFGAWTLRARPSAWRSARAVLAAIALTVVAIAATHTLQARAGYTAQRYFHPFTVFVAPFAILGVERAVAALVGARGISARAAWGVALGLFGLASVAPLRHARASYAAHCARIERLHTRPAEALAWATPMDALIGVEAAGSSRYHSSRRILDLLGLNAHALAHAGSATALHCEIVRQRPTFFLVPQAWLALLAPDFELRVVASYESPRWSEKSVDRVVVFAQATARPEVEADCRQTGASK